MGVPTGEARAIDARIPQIPTGSIAGLAAASSLSRGSAWRECKVLQSWPALRNVAAAKRIDPALEPCLEFFLPDRTLTETSQKQTQIRFGGEQLENEFGRQVSNDVQTV